MNSRAQVLVDLLNLVPHPEGGYYQSTFKAELKSTEDLLDYTSIYFLLTEQEVSHFHQLTADELWYFHEGDPLDIHMIHPDGRYAIERLGLNVVAGEKPQVKVSKGTIFGSKLADGGNYGLVGCMVAPGFTFEDFKLFTEAELLSRFPEHKTIIKALT